MQSLDAAVLDFSSLLMSPTDMFANLANDIGADIGGVDMGGWDAQALVSLPGNPSVSTSDSMVS